MYRDPTNGHEALCHAGAKADVVEASGPTSRSSSHSLAPSLSACHGKEQAVGHRELFPRRKELPRNVAGKGKCSTDHRAHMSPRQVQTLDLASDSTLQRRQEICASSKSELGIRLLIKNNFTMSSSSSSQTCLKLRDFQLPFPAS